MKCPLWLTILLLMTGIACFSQSSKDQLIISCFYQGKANNCASVAIIKAAMLKYGYKNMFHMVTAGSDYYITLQDGTIFTISQDELDRAKDKCKFGIKQIPELGREQDSVIWYSYLAYACIAKFISLHGYWGRIEDGSRHLTDHSTFKSALRFISYTSYATDYCYRLLGLQVKDPNVPDFHDPSEIVGETGVILYSGVHAVVAYQGQLDCHGEWKPVSKGEVCGNQFTWYLILK